MVFLKLASKLMLIGFVTLGVLFVISLLLITVTGRAILALVGAVAYLVWEGRNG